jgi:hypothetical protein
MEIASKRSLFHLFLRTKTDVDHSRDPPTREYGAPAAGTIQKPQLPYISPELDEFYDDWQSWKRNVAGDLNFAKAQNNLFAASLGLARAELIGLVAPDAPNSAIPFLTRFAHFYPTTPIRLIKDRHPDLVDYTLPPPRIPGITAKPSTSAPASSAPLPPRHPSPALITPHKAPQPEAPLSRFAPNAKPRAASVPRSPPPEVPAVHRSTVDLPKVSVFDRLSSIPDVAKEAAAAARQKFQFVTPITMLPQAVPPVPAPVPYINAGAGPSASLHAPFAAPLVSSVPPTRAASPLPAPTVHHPTAYAPAPPVRRPQSVPEVPSSLSFQVSPMRLSQFPAVMPSMRPHSAQNPTAFASQPQIMQHQVFATSSAPAPTVQRATAPPAAPMPPDVLMIDDLPVRSAEEVALEERVFDQEVEIEALQEQLRDLMAHVATSNPATTSSVPAPQHFPQFTMSAATQPAPIHHQHTHSAPLQSFGPAMQRLPPSAPVQPRPVSWNDPQPSVPPVQQPQYSQQTFSQRPPQHAIVPDDVWVKCFGKLKLQDFSLTSDWH